MTDLRSHRSSLFEAVDDDGSGNWLNALVRAGFEVRPHARGTEFEIKYSTNQDGVGGELGEYARALTLQARLPNDIISPSWIVFSESMIDYWLEDQSEWTRRLSSEGGGVLKRKRHNLFRNPVNGTPLLQAEESFVRDLDSISDIVSRLGPPLGAMRKARAKAHYVHLAEGIVFNVVESRCRIGDAEQLQIELEYGAHVCARGQASATESSVDELRGQLWRMHDHLLPLISKLELVPTTELKRDFMKAHSASGMDEAE